jgi:hypothetical protein
MMGIFFAPRERVASCLETPFFFFKQDIYLQREFQQAIRVLLVGCLGTEFTPSFCFFLHEYTYLKLSWGGHKSEPNNVSSFSQYARAPFPDWGNTVFPVGRLV